MRVRFWICLAAITFALSLGAPPAIAADITQDHYLVFDREGTRFVRKTTEALAWKDGQTLKVKDGVLYIVSRDAKSSRVPCDTYTLANGDILEFTRQGVELKHFAPRK